MADQPGRARPVPTVVIAATPRGWASRLHAQAADHGGVVVRTTVLTAADAVAERADVVVVDDVCSFLTPALVAGLHRAGRAVIGVCETEDRDGRSLLARLGVDEVVTTDVDGEGLVQAVIRTAGSASRATASTAADRQADAHTADARRTGRPGATGAVLGITGPHGGVGVTEVAIELAAQIAEAGHPTVIVDLDETAPAAAQRLALPLQPNVLTALDGVVSGGSAAECIRSLSRRCHLGALPGMADPADWAAVADDAVPSLLSALTDRGWVVVADLGHSPSAVHTSVGRRFGHAAAVAASCTELVLVANPSPISVARAAVLRSAVAHRRPVRALLNRDARGALTGRESRDELARSLGVNTVDVLPEDDKVRSAAWEGCRVRPGRFTRAVRAAAQTWGWLG